SKYYAFRCASPGTCSVSRWTATALPPRRLTRSVNSSAAGSRAVAAKHETARRPLAAGHLVRGALACRRASLQGQALPTRRGRLPLRPRTRTVEAARGTVHEDLPARGLSHLRHLRAETPADQCRSVPGSGRPPRPRQRAGADLRADVHPRL